MARTAYEYALDLLSARAYTSASLRRKLKQKEFPADEVEAAVTRLVEGGLLDDRKFAVEFARQKIAVGGASVRRVRQQLAQKGIPSSDADDAIERMLDKSRDYSHGFVPVLRAASRMERAGGEAL